MKDREILAWLKEMSYASRFSIQRPVVVVHDSVYAYVNEEYWPKVDDPSSYDIPPTGFFEEEVKPNPINAKLKAWEAPIPSGFNKGGGAFTTLNQREKAKVRAKRAKDKANRKRKH